jgi:hypothetical protein
MLRSSAKPSPGFSATSNTAASGRPFAFWRDFAFWQSLRRLTLERSQFDWRAGDHAETIVMRRIIAAGIAVADRCQIVGMR